MSNQKLTVATDVKSLNKGLLEIFNGIRQKTVQIKDAKECSNAAGKYLKGISVQLEYRRMTGEVKKEVDGLS